MNKILTFIFSLVVFAPVAAFAATITNVEFSNGDVTIDGKGGNTTQATLRIVVPASEVVEYVQTDVLGDGLGPVNHSVGGTLGLQEGTHNVKVPVKFPPNTATYDLYNQTAGIYGGIRSVDGDDGVNGSITFTGALRTVSSSSSSSSSEESAISNLEQQIALLFDKLDNLLNPTTSSPSISESCKAYNTSKMGAMFGVYSPQNTKLQGFLLSQGASIPALEAGASFGFYGPQTQAAMNWFASMNTCN